MMNDYVGIIATMELGIKITKGDNRERETQCSSRKKSIGGVVNITRLNLPSLSPFFEPNQIFIERDTKKE
jgi:hypothetical protein